MDSEEFWKILHSMPEPSPVFYRLYYDDLGRPMHYTMETLDGNYIEIDQETYSKSNLNVRVVNGVVCEIPKPCYTRKLVITDSGTPCHPSDVTIVVPLSEQNIKWSAKTYVE